MAITIEDLHRVSVDLRVDVQNVERGVYEVVAALRGGPGSAGGQGGGAPGGPSTPRGPTGFAKTLDDVANKATRAGVAIAGFSIVFDRMMSSMGQQMTRFVALANPAAVTRFNIALENAMSAMGRIFLPVLERFTVMIQRLGNAIESLSPQAKALIGALAVGGGLAAMFAAGAAAAAILVKVLGGWVSVIILVVSAVAGVLTTMSEGQELLASFGQILKAVGSIIEVVTQIFVVVFLPAIQFVAQVVKNVAEFIVRMMRMVARLLGIEIPEYDPNRRQAQAVRQSQITDLRGFANRAYTTAFGGAASDVNGQILTENQKQTKLLEKIANKATPSGFANDLMNRPGYTLGRIAKGAGQTFGDAIQWTRDRMRSIFD